MQITLDRELYLQKIKLLNLNYKRTYKPEMVEAIWDRLKDVSNSEFAQIVNYVMDEVDYIPKIADFVKAKKKICHLVTYAQVEDLMQSLAAQASRVDKPMKQSQQEFMEGINILEDGRFDQFTSYRPYGEQALNTLYAWVGMMPYEVRGDTSQQEKPWVKICSEAEDFKVDYLVSKIKARMDIQDEPTPPPAEDNQTETPADDKETKGPSQVADLLKDQNS